MVSGGDVDVGVINVDDVSRRAVLGTFEFLRVDMLRTVGAWTGSEDDRYGECGEREEVCVSI